MARDAALDLEATSSAAGLLRPPPAASLIAQERVGPGAPSVWFVLVAVALCLAALSVELLLGHRAGATAAEQQTAARLLLWNGFGLMGGRVAAAIAQALAVGGVAMAARRLAHSDMAGLLAAALVAADPASLLLGSLALPQAVAVAGMAWAFAFVSSPVPVLHWLAGLALAVAVLAVPLAALWILPLALFLLLRGHIYAAPQHFGLALAQVAILPALALVARVGLQGGIATLPSCLGASGWQVLVLRRLVMPGTALVLLPNPVTSLVGAGAVLFLGLGGLLFAITRFRIARLPGRLQVRVVAPFPPVLGRGLWLLLLVLVAPPAMWLPLFAIAVALGVQELGEDAPGFGLALALVLLAFAGLVLWRAWGGVVGDPGGVAQAVGMVPWATVSSC